MKYLLAIVILISTSSSPAFAQEREINNGISMTVSYVKAHYDAGIRIVEDLNPVCKESAAYVSGYLKSFNEIPGNSLKCIGDKIGGVRDLSPERYYFGSGDMYRAQNVFHWDISVDMWFYNTPSQALVTYSDDHNYVKVFIPDLEKPELVFQDANIPSLNRIGIYSKYWYPEDMLQRYYNEKYSTWPVQEFVGDIFSSSVFRYKFIEYLKEEEKKTN